MIAQNAPWRVSATRKIHSGSIRGTFAARQAGNPVASAERGEEFMGRGVERRIRLVWGGSQTKETEPVGT